MSRESTKGRRRAWLEAYKANLFNVTEACQALADGSFEPDRVINIGRMCSGHDDAVRDEVRLMRENVSLKIGIKGAHGIRTLDGSLLFWMNLQTLNNKNNI